MGDGPDDFNENLFEMLILEGMRAEMDYCAQKREALQAFDGFDQSRWLFTMRSKYRSCFANEGIIRNRLKVKHKLALMLKPFPKVTRKVQTLMNLCDICGFILPLQTI